MLKVTLQRRRLRKRGFRKFQQIVSFAGQIVSFTNQASLKIVKKNARPHNLHVRVIFRHALSLRYNHLTYRRNQNICDKVVIERYHLYRYRVLSLAQF